MASVWNYQAKDHEQASALMQHMRAQFGPQWIAQEECTVFCIQNGAIGHIIDLSRDSASCKFAKHYTCPHCQQMLYHIRKGQIEPYIVVQKIGTRRKRKRSETEAESPSPPRKQRKVRVSDAESPTKQNSAMQANNFFHSNDSLLTYCVKRNYLELATFALTMLPHAAMPFVPDEYGDDSPYSIAVGLRRFQFIKLFDDQQVNANAITYYEVALLSLLDKNADEHAAAHLLDKSIDYVRFQYFDQNKLQLPEEKFNVCTALKYYFCIRMFSYLLNFVIVDGWAIDIGLYLPIFEQAEMMSQCKQLKLYRNILEALSKNVNNQLKVDVKKWADELKANNLIDDSLKLELVNAIWKRKYSAKKCDRTDMALRHLPTTHILQLLFSSLYGKERILTELLHEPPFVKYHILANLAFNNNANYYDRLEHYSAEIPRQSDKWDLMRFKCQAPIDPSKFHQADSSGCHALLGLIYCNKLTIDCEYSKYMFIRRMMEIVDGYAISLIFPSTLYYEVKNDIPIRETLNKMFDSIERISDVKRMHKSLFEFAKLNPNCANVIIDRYIYKFQPYAAMNINPSAYALVSLLMSQMYRSGKNMNNYDIACVCRGVVRTHCKQLPDHEARIMVANHIMEVSWSHPKHQFNAMLAKSHFKIGNFEESLTNSNHAMESLKSMHHSLHNKVALYNIRASIATNNLSEIRSISTKYKPETESKKNAIYYLCMSMYHILKRRPKKATEMLDLCKFFFQDQACAKYDIMQVQELLQCFVKLYRGNRGTTCLALSLPTKQEARALLNRVLPCNTHDQDWILMHVYGSRPFLKQPHQLPFCDMSILCTK